MIASFKYFLCLYLSFFCCSASSAQNLAKAHFVEINGHQFQVELARTPQEWGLGLMYREKLGSNQGMFFVGQVERQQSFWMKNTPLPLDIIYISKDLKIVSIAENTVPFSEAPLPSLKPAMHVLEVNAGRCKDLGIQAGAKVKLIGIKFLK